MNPLIRKTFCLHVSALALLFALTACASGSKKTYCDLVVEDQAQTEDQNQKNKP
jgi:uncharacterized lipoprotein YmbA